MVPAVRLAPRSPLQSLPVRDELVCFLTEQQLTGGRTRLVEGPADLARQLDAKQAPDAHPLWVLPHATCNQRVLDLELPGEGHLVWFDHRLVSAPGSIVAACEAWLASNLLVPPAGADGPPPDPWDRAVSTSLVLQRRETTRIEQPLTLQDVLTLLGAPVDLSPPAELLERVGEVPSGILNCQSLLTLAHSSL